MYWRTLAERVVYFEDIEEGFALAALGESGAIPGARLQSVGALGMCFLRF